MSIGKAILRILGLVTLGDYEKMVADNLKANTELSKSAGEAEAQATTLRQTANQYQARINELSLEAADLTAQVEASDKRAHELEISNSSLLLAQDDLKEKVASLGFQLEQADQRVPSAHVNSSGDGKKLNLTLHTANGAVIVRSLVSNKTNQAELETVAKRINDLVAKS